MRSRRFQLVIGSLMVGSTGCTGAEDPVQAMNAGIERLEEYDYGGAYRIFDRLAKAHPGWEAAHVNRGIAALNLQKDEKEEIDYLPIAEKAFARALEVNPKCVHALVCRGVLYKHLNKIDEMLRDYTDARAIDPNDPQILFQRAVALLEKGNLKEAQVDLERAVKLQPSLGSAHYRFYFLLRTQDAPRATESLERFKALSSAEVAAEVGIKYGECGKYSFAMRGTAPPGWKEPIPAWAPAETIPFGSPIRITHKPALARQDPAGRPLAPALAAGDLNGDGRLELVFTGEQSASGAPAVTVYTQESSGVWALSSTHPFPDAGVCAIGDVDADFDADVVLAGPGWLRILENDGKGSLIARELKAEGTAFAGTPVRLTVLDADSDWDVDLVCLRIEAGADGKTRSRVEILNNNRDGTFRDISAQAKIGPFDFAASELVVSDLDDDIDADILVLDGATGEAHAFANDRVWAYHRVEPPAGAPRAPGVVSTAGGDFDGDLDLDLVFFCGDSLRFWRNEGSFSFAEDADFTRRFGALGGIAGALADWQGALRVSLVALGTKGDTAGAAFLSSPGASKAMRLELEGASAEGARSALALVTQEGRGPELVVYDTVRGGFSYPLPPSASWFVFDLDGPRKPVSKMERANAAGVGTSVEVTSGLKRARFWLDGGSGSAGRHPVRGFCGLAGASDADYVRLLWPDTVLQAERGLTPGKIHRIKEIERKPTSCPILFAWTGERFEFVADFLGVGGLGYFELPGVYSKPDPTEYVLLPELRPQDGFYRLDVLEPLEECTYLDDVKLTVVEHASDVTVLPDEMFAIRGPQPGYRLLAFREKLFARSARDASGRDVTAALLDADRKYAYQIDRDPRFPGLARQAHAVELDFEGELEALLSRGSSAKPVLFLHGFVEYGYSTSNFAAWQADCTFHAPSVRVERNGKWVPLREEWGFPGGYPRYMAVDLTGLLARGDRRLRIDTNLEIHWDQAFIADASVTDFHAADLAFDAAELTFRGFPREVSPDGELPRIYVHGDFEPDAHIKPFPGRYTRYGDVRPLLEAPDDRLANLGPGDGLELKVRADRLPPPPPGRRRTFLLKAFGYCKDMDLYTAHSDRIEPLPFRAMSGYPFRPDEAAAQAAAHAGYTGEWSSREVKR